MIKVEGYKAFHGTMKIEPKNGLSAFYVCDVDWLYKPDTDCLYGNGQSFPAEICKVEAESVY